jgi:hypothetical protein
MSKIAVLLCRSRETSVSVPVLAGEYSGSRSSHCGR